MGINLFAIGRKQLYNIDAQLATHQAYFFAMLGNVDLARAIALDALTLV